MVQVSYPKWLIPSPCVDGALAAAGKEEAGVTNWQNMCPKFSAKSNDDQCKRITSSQPLYSCTYIKFLSNQQQHIRNHGAVRWVSNTTMVLSKSNAASDLGPFLEC